MGGRWGPRAAGATVVAEPSEFMAKSSASLWPRLARYLGKTGRPLARCTKLPIGGEPLIMVGLSGVSSDAHGPCPALDRRHHRSRLRLPHKHQHSPPPHPPSRSPRISSQPLCWLSVVASMAILSALLVTTSSLVRHARHSQSDDPLRLDTFINDSSLLATLSHQRTKATLDGPDSTLLDSAGIDVDGDKSKQRQQTGNTRRFLMSRLAHLIMNHEPEFIAEQLNGTRVRGLIENRPLEQADDDNVKEAPSETNIQAHPLSPPSMLLVAHATDANDEAALLATAQDTQLGEQQQAEGAMEGDQMVTCSPDYEDQALIEASGNLTAEQQQQLLLGSSSLLNGSSSNMANNSQLDNQLLAATGRPGGQQCVQPGSRMIEMITKVITPILFSIIIVVGLLGNIIVMLVILEDRKTERELTPTNLLILDLSLADLSFIIFCIPFTGWDYSVGHWVFGSLWCKFNQYLIVVCALSSIYTLVLMSIDRFMAIVYPIECISYRTSKNMLYAIYIKWILILVIASPTVAMHGLIDSPLGLDQYNCRFLADQFNPLHFQIVFFITSYLFPLILIFCLYLSLLNKLWFGSRPHGHKESLKMLESKKKVTWLVASIVVVFALCWCPIQVMLILMRLKTHKITATYVAIQVFSHTLGYMNSCVNPIVYAFASETFVNSFKRSSLGRLCCHCFGYQIPSDHDRSTTVTNVRNNSQFNQNANSAIMRYNGQTTEFDEAAPLHLRSGSHPKDGAQNYDGHVSTTNLPMRPNYDSNSAAKIVSLPLEPRDRQASPITVPSQGDNNKGQTAAKKLTKNNPNNKNALVPREPTSQTLINKPIPAKQQLVARVVQPSNQVSHQCEPDYQ